MNITIYTTTTCPYCKMLMAYLDEKSIFYTQKLVDDDETAQNEMVAISGGYMGVPYTVIEKDGNKKSVVGFDKTKLDEILGISNS